MVHINRRYIDSHWLTFVIRGVVAVLFGWVTLFHSNNSFPTIVSIIGLFLISLCIIEFVNALHRTKTKTGWVISILVALFDATAALFLILAPGDLTWHLVTIALYTIIRGVAEIVIGFRTTVDPTDRFIWILTGVCGTIMGIVILNSGSIDINSFVRFFGAYLLIFGVSSLIYGVDNRHQKLEDKKARSESAKARKTKKTAKKK
ncbi:DUF308 domain-containing protein [Candidatus Saccharibacteria bacterium]|nr:DUF308 domain-containing protein [Candidatus Saccharibacteria bacterium]